jgi:acyl-CoA thioesterase
MPGTLDLTVTLAVHGRATTQARCVVTVTGDDGTTTEILTVNGALGSRDVEGEGSWAERPVVPGPDECPRRRPFDMVKDTVMDIYEIRQAAGLAWGSPDDPPGARAERATGPEAGRSALWIRLPGGPRATTSADLAIVGDHVPSGLSTALGGMIGGNSLDNSLRVAASAVTEWVLVDIRIHAVSAGFGHGLAHLWAQDGTLLGTASQSVIVRRFDPARHGRVQSEQA